MKVISRLGPLLAAALYVSAHGVITDVFGANGLHGVGFGVVSTITTLDQFQQESSIINDNEIAGGLTGICGRTLGGGVIDVQAMLAGSKLKPNRIIEILMLITPHYFSCVNSWPTDRFSRWFSQHEAIPTRH